MLKITAILLLMEAVNWFTNWPLGWQILFSFVGVSLWIMFYAMSKAEPDPEEYTKDEHKFFKGDDVLW